jgi:homoserine kinase
MPTLSAPGEPRASVFSSHSVTVHAPGTTSNVGPGFDCLGAAVSGMGDRVTACRTAAEGVAVDRVSDPRIPQEPERNTAALAAAAILRRGGCSGGMVLSIEKGLPLAGGLGGSAASAVGGAVAANALFGLGLPDEELLDAALEAEAAVSGGRHADNVAPCLLGGAILVVALDPLRLTRLEVHPSIRLALVTPRYSVETSRARRVLPDSVRRLDAVGQAARLGGLLLGLERGDQGLVRQCLADSIAEPARAPMYPGFPEARRAGLAAGALGVVVSGAGPTVLALAPAGELSAVGEAVRGAYARLGIEATAHLGQVDPQGARLLP